MMKFEELERLLTDARAGSRAAECHGFLCGYLCVSDNIEKELFDKYLLSAPSGSDRDRTVECVDQIAGLADDVNEQISSGSFDLQLLLPDDQSPLVERSVALTEWCQGFLSGLGIGGIVDFDTISAESRELIDDLYKICNLDVESSADAGEEGEFALTELIEYVRMGAIFIHQEFHNSPSVMDKPEVLH